MKHIATAILMFLLCALSPGVLVFENINAQNISLSTVSEGCVVNGTIAYFRPLPDGSELRIVECNSIKQFELNIIDDGGLAYSPDGQLLLLTTIQPNGDSGVTIFDSVSATSTILASEPGVYYFNLRWLSNTDVAYGEFRASGTGGHIFYVQNVQDLRRQITKATFYTDGRNVALGFNAEAFLSSGNIQIQDLYTGGVVKVIEGLNVSNSVFWLDDHAVLTGRMSGLEPAIQIVDINESTATSVDLPCDSAYIDDYSAVAKGVVATCSFFYGGTDIVHVDLTGTNIRFVANGSAYETNAKFSPDGSQVSYVSYSEDASFGSGHAYLPHIYVVSSDGTLPKLVDVGIIHSWKPS